MFVKPTVLEPPPTVEDKKKEKVNDDGPGTQEPHSIRRPPICHHCGLSGHVRPQCSLLKAQKAKAKKEMPRLAHYGTRPAASIRLHGIRHLTKHQGMSGLQKQAPWYQRPQQWFVPANHSGTYKSKPNDVNPIKNNETQQRKGTQDRSINRFEWKTSTRCL
jgi:hypothetical protein